LPAAKEEIDPGRFQGRSILAVEAVGYGELTLGKRGEMVGAENQRADQRA
jgi:hypothetical protein